MDKEETLDNCPHCGTKLSPWQKVLLNVDRAIMCKNCWYRIILDPKSLENSKQQKSSSKEKEDKKEKK